MDVSETKVRVWVRRMGQVVPDELLADRWKGEKEWIFFYLGEQQAGAYRCCDVTAIQRVPVNSKVDYA